MYQEIFSILQMYLPSEWNKVVFYAEYEPDSYMMKFFVKEDGDFIDCYDLGIPVEGLDAAFAMIDDIIAPEWGKKKWSNMTMTVSRDGTFITNFGYQDLIDSNFRDEWYLNYLNKKRP